MCDGRVPRTWSLPDGGSIVINSGLMVIRRRRYGMTTVNLKTIDQEHRKITKEWIRTVSTP